MYDKRTRERTARNQDIHNEVVCMIKGQKKGHLIIKTSIVKLYDKRTRKRTSRNQDIHSEIVCMIKGQEKGQLLSLIHI